MKLNQLFRPALFLTALLAVAVWGGWAKKVLSAGRQDLDSSATKKTAESSKLKGDEPVDRKSNDSIKEDSGQSSSTATLLADENANDQKELDTQEDSRQTRELLQKSITLLRNRSFTANLRQRGMLFGTELIASGTYLHADGGKGGVRTDLELQTKNLSLKIEMVNDGVYYFRRVESKDDKDESPESKTIDTQAQPTVHRINLREIREQIAADAAWPGHWIAFGGLYLFMDQARRSFDFGPIQTRKIKGAEYDVIKGTWKPEKLASLVPKQKESILKRHAINWQQIPMHIPLEIEIYLYKNSDLAGFPFRIIFYRPNQELLEGLRNAPVLITEYSDPKFIETPVQSDFQFNADENEVVDITDDFLSSLKQ